MLAGLLLMLCAAGSEADPGVPWAQRPTNPALERARTELATLDARAAEQSLASVESGFDLSRDEVLAFFELKARLEGMRDNDEGARRWFEALLELNPSFELGNRASPKLSVPLAEARKSVTKRGALGVELKHREKSGLVQELTIELIGSASRVSTVDASLVEDGVSRVVPPRGIGALVRVPATGKVVEVLVRLRTTAGWVLLEKTARFEARPDVGRMIESRPEPEPQVVVAPPPPALTPREAHPARRGAAWLFSGLAVAAGVGGGVFFGVGSSAEAEFVRALEGQMGGYLPITVVRAQALDRQVQVGGAGSTISWISAGAFALTAATLWLLELLGDVTR